MKSFFGLILFILLFYPVTSQDWQEIKSLSNPGGYYGNSVATDGTIAVVGAPGDDDYGAAYIYYRVPASFQWNYITKLFSDLISPFSGFGFSVAISGDYVIVGAPNEEEPVDNKQVGGIYIFQKNKGGANQWGKVVRISPADADPEDSNFGHSVSISGNYAIVGENGPTRRAFILYKDQGGTDQWQPEDTLNFPEFFDMVYSVDIDGDYAVVGDVRVDIDTGGGVVTNAGAAYIFQRNVGEPGKWGEIARVNAEDPHPQDYFGTSLDLSEQILVAGVQSNDYDHEGNNYLLNSGAAYVFYKDRGGTNHWGQVCKLTASDREQYDEFGSSVAVCGNSILVGSHWEDENADGIDSLANAGSVYIYEKDYGAADHWGEMKKIVPPDRSAGRQFGLSVSARNSYAIVGTVKEKSYILRNYIQASNISFTSVTSTSMQINWTKGNGSYRTVFMKEGEAGLAEPTDNYNYSANANFGDGDQIGSSNYYCVYNGTGESAQVTNLTPATTYTISVIEYDIIDDNKDYNLNESLDNPAQQRTAIELTGAGIHVGNNKLTGTEPEMQYSLNSTNGTDGNWYDCAEDTTIVQFDPGPVYVRDKLHINNFRLVYTIPAREAAPSVTINYLTEKTNEIISDQVEYNYNNDFTGENLSGENTALSLIPDNNEAPNFSIDYSAEETAGVISNVYEYAYNPGMSGAITGIFNPVPLSPGTDVYIRQKATVSSFSGYIQHLIVPERPPVPVVSLSDKNSAITTFMKSSDGTGDRVGETDGFAYSTNNGFTWSDILNNTTVDATGIKNIIVKQKVTDESFETEPTTNLDLLKPAAFITSSFGCNGSGDSISLQSNTDNGQLYLILNGEPAFTPEDLDAAVTANKGTKTMVQKANSDIQVSTYGLPPGVYYAFSTDDLDSISDKSPDSVHIYQIPFIDLGDDIIKCETTEISLDAGSGLSQYLWSPGGQDSRIIKVTDQGDYCIIVTDEKGCTGRDTINVLYNVPYQDEQICVVTIDLATGNNVIVWEKTPDVGIVAYKIYRESTIGVYNPIGTIPVDELSIFKDTTANPESQSYLYKIRAVDSCGTESLLANSKYHRPSFLQYVSSEGGINLEWTDYNIQGVPDIGDYLTSYAIHRGTDSTGLTEYLVVGSINTYTDKDPNAMKRRYYYRVAALLKDPCFPTEGKKADSSPYSHSMSNIEDNRIQKTQGESGHLNPESVEIYPNPFSDRTMIRFPNPDGLPYKLMFIDFSGRIVFLKENIVTDEMILERGTLPRGLYLLELRGVEIYRGKIIIE